MGWKRPVANAIFGGLSSLGMWEAANRLARGRITVLAYHRVVDVSSPAFDTYRPNVSASPEGFQAQMDHVQAHFDVIGIEHLTRWLQGTRDLPTRPLLITFDDGYRDVFEHAYPILRQRGLPALIFVTTGFIENSRPFYWDRVAHAFHHTRESFLSIPRMGDIHWTDPEQRERALRQVIQALKSLPDQEKARVVDTILENLGTGARDTRLESLAMDWDQLREMADNGVAVGGHTHTHPILTRIPLEQAQDEIRTCMEKIETQIGRPARTFAYTNGLESDFNVHHEQFLAEMGVQTAFSLLPGPTTRAEVRARPLAIRRVMIHHRDHIPRFKAKLGGAARLARDRL